MAIQRFVAKEKLTATKLNSFADEVEKVANDVETYIGAGKEQVVVSCTSQVEGVSTAGLVLNVYLNGATQNPQQYTTDANGQATFRVDVGYTYKIAFPEIEGCAEIKPITHMASVAQRSVEVVYEEVDENVEKVVIHVIKYVQSTAQAWGGQSVIVTANGISTTYTSDANGKVTVEIPVGTQYTVKMNAVDGFWIYGQSAQTYTATLSQRNVYFNFHDMGVGIFLVDTMGVSYTYDEWVSSGKDGAEAVFIKIATSALVNNGGVFLIKIDDITSKAYATTRQWCNNNVLFNTIPSNGNSTTVEYYYDGLGASQAIRDEGVQRGYTTNAASYCLGQTYNLNNAVLQGFLYSIGQERAVYANLTPLNAMLALVRPSATNTFTNYVNTSKWVSAQNGGNNAYYVNAGVSNYNGYKNLNTAVLVSYALPL